MNPNFTNQKLKFLTPGMNSGAATSPNSALQRAWRVSGWGFHPQPSRYAEMFHVKHAPGAPCNQRTPNTRICNANNVRVSFCMGVGFSISRNPA